MNTEQERIAWLFERYFEKTATPEERAELAGIAEEAANKEAIMALFASSWERYQGDGEVVSAERSEQMLEAILGGEDSTGDKETTDGTGSHSKDFTGKVIRMKQPYWNRKKWGIAAAVLFGLIGSGWWIVAHKKQPVNHFAFIESAPVKDVAPGHNGAVLTLDNGQQIVLDSARNGLLAQQGNSRIIKQADGLNYHAVAKKGEVVYNTISTPRGRQYPNLVLADGTKVWLDAGSSIRFPVVFMGTERRVTITGQVWFEVVHDVKMPFKIMAKGTEISDLGTQFNVNAYDDEANLTVSLLQGLISIRSVLIRPGQQAQVGSHGEWKLVNDANMGEVMAWKNGFFSFQHADIGTVMRQISRWYDLDVRFEGAHSTETFSGKIGRNLSLADLLEGLTRTRVHYRIEDGKKMVVLP